MLDELFDCRAAVEDASSALDGELPFPRRLVFALHVRFCTNCQRHVKQLRTVGRALDQQRTPLELSAEARARVLASLQRKP